MNRQRAIIPMPTPLPFEKPKRYRRIGRVPRAHPRRIRSIERLAEAGHCPYVLDALPYRSLASLDLRVDVVRYRGGSDNPRLFPGETDGFSVYRIAFADGSAYLGITDCMVMDEVEYHFGATTEWWRTRRLDARIHHEQGTRRVLIRVAAGRPCRVECLASGLSSETARVRFLVENAALTKPLHGGGGDWNDPFKPRIGLTGFIFLSMGALSTVMFVLHHPNYPEWSLPVVLVLFGVWIAVWLLEDGEWRRSQARPGALHRLYRRRRHRRRKK